MMKTVSSFLLVLLLILNFPKIGAGQGTLKIGALIPYSGR